MAKPNFFFLLWINKLRLYIPLTYYSCSGFLPQKLVETKKKKKLKVHKTNLFGHKLEKYTSFFSPSLIHCSVSSVTPLHDGTGKNSWKTCCSAAHSPHMRETPDCTPQRAKKSCRSQLQPWTQR